jgi:hypothetical protein
MKYVGFTVSANYYYYYYYYSTGESNECACDVHCNCTTKHGGGGEYAEIIVYQGKGENRDLFVINGVLGDNIKLELKNRLNE